MRYAIPWEAGFLMIVSSLSHGINEARKRHQDWKSFVFVEQAGRWVPFIEWERSHG